MSTLVLGLLHSNLGQCLTSPGSLRGESLCREGPPGPPSSPRPGQTGSGGRVRGLMPGPEVQTDRVPELGATSGGALAITTDAVAGGRKSKVPAGGCPARPPSHQALAWPLLRAGLPRASASSCEGAGHTAVASFTSITSSKASSPNAVTLGAGTATYERWGTQFGPRQVGKCRLPRSAPFRRSNGALDLVTGHGRASEEPGTLRQVSGPPHDPGAEGLLWLPGYADNTTKMLAN